MTKPQIIDAHHHLWDLNHCNYPWLMAKGQKRFFGNPTPIQKNYLPSNLLEDSSNFELIGSVHIQVGTSLEDSVKETDWLQALPRMQPLLPSSIIGFADLTDPALEITLKAHAKNSRFKGIRQIVGRHPSEDQATGTDTLLSNPKFPDGLQRLADLGLSFDLQLIEHQYDRAFDILSKVPYLSVAICHLGSPWDLSDNGFRKWHRAMRNFATLPNLYIKASGFGMFKPDWTTEDIKPYILEALEIFGSKRIMAGTNFPVDKLYGSYDRIWNSLMTLSPDEIVFERLTKRNAAEFYKIL